MFVAVLLLLMVTVLSVIGLGLCLMRLRQVENQLVVLQDPDEFQAMLNRFHFEKQAQMEEEIKHRRFEDQLEEALRAPPEAVLRRDPPPQDDPLHELGRIIGRVGPRLA